MIELEGSVYVLDLLKEQNQEYVAEYLKEQNPEYGSEFLKEQPLKKENRKSCFYLFGDYLYFKAIEDSVGYAEKVPQNVTFQPKVKRVKQDFEYSQGFRIGMGADFDQNRWKLRASWMCYDISPPKRYAHDPYFGLLAVFDIPVWGALGNSLVNTLKGEWHLKMDTVDLDLRRAIDVKGFSVEFLSGIKLAYIEQDIDTYYGAFEIDFSNVVTPHTVLGHSRFFGLGPLFGLELNYKMSKQWQFFINGNFSWLIGSFDTRTKYKDFTPQTVPSDSKITIKDHTSKISIFEQVQVGLDKRWDFNRFCTGITLGWELQIFKNQMNLNYFSTFVSPPSGSDLSLYGPFFRARLCF